MHQDPEKSDLIKTDQLNTFEQGTFIRIFEWNYINH